MAGFFFSGWVGGLVEEGIRKEEEEEEQQEKEK